jgi:membrane dipeptidase
MPHETTGSARIVSDVGGEVSEAALRIHRTALVIDGHNDLPWKLREKSASAFEIMDIAAAQPQLHTDIPRLRAGGVGAQFWSAWVPPETQRTGGATRIALEQIDLIHRMVGRYSDTFAFARTADDVIRIRKSGRIASLIGVEGGHTIENSLGVLRMFHDLGVRYLTLTHTETIDWADSSTDEARHGGLTEFGEQVVREMNRLGMLIDISHVSDDTVRDVLRVTRAPIIASHSSCKSLADHPRNLPDDLLKGIARNGGVIMVNFYSGFVHPEAAANVRELFPLYRKLREEHGDGETVEKAIRAWHEAHPMPHGDVGTVVDHIDHVVKIAGIDHVGLGSDYDGITRLPAGLEDVSCLPRITEELLRRGYGEGDIRKVLGENALRVMRQVEQAARSRPAGE